MADTSVQKNKIKTIDLAYIAIGTVFIAVCSWINVPTVIPFTMQTFAVFFVLSALGGRNGTSAIIVYVLLGAAGIPVFAQFTSGLGILLGSTGGYIVGFVFTGAIYWISIRLLGKKLYIEIIALVIGIIVLYAFGTAWFMLVYSRTEGKIGIAAALSWCVLPFIIPDLIKLSLALTLSQRLSPLLKLQYKQK